MESETARLQRENAALNAENDELKIINTELATENKALKAQLAKVGGLGDTEKERLLAKILKEHPNCYGDIEFEEAFTKGSKL